MNHLDSAAVCHTMLHTASDQSAKHLQGNCGPLTDTNFKTIENFVCQMLRNAFQHTVIEALPRYANHNVLRMIKKKEDGQIKGKSFERVRIMLNYSFWLSSEH